MEDTAIERVGELLKGWDAVDRQAPGSGGLEVRMNDQLIADLFLLHAAAQTSGVLWLEQSEKAVAGYIRANRRQEQALNRLLARFKNVRDIAFNQEEGETSEGLLDRIRKELLK